jgi:hypothetical protein
MSLNITPKGHYILIELIEVQQKSKGGIILTDAGKEQKAVQFAKVLKIGPTAFMGIDGCDPTKYAPSHPRYTMEPYQIWGISIGETVGMNRYEGSDVNVAGIKNYRVIPDTQLTHGVEGEIEISKTDV